MNWKIIYLSVCCILISNNLYCKQNEKYNVDSLFIYHFKVLDSIASDNFIDSTLMCIESIKFMEINTGINSNTDGNYFGKTSFTKDDLKTWHDWYMSNKGNLIWDKKKKIIKIKKNVAMTGHPYSLGVQKACIYGVNLIFQVRHLAGTYSENMVYKNDKSLNYLLTDEGMVNKSSAAMSMSTI